MEQLGKYMQKLRVVKNLQTLVWPYDSFKMPRITGMRLNVSAHNEFASSIHVCPTERNPSHMLQQQSSEVHSQQDLYEVGYTH